MCAFCGVFGVLGGGHCRCGCRDKSGPFSKGGWIQLLEVQLLYGTWNKNNMKIRIFGLGGVFDGLTVWPLKICVNVHKNVFCKPCKIGFSKHVCGV